MPIGPTKDTAIELFSYPVPGYRVKAAWVSDELVPVPESTGLVLPGRELFQAPLPWAQFEGPKIQIPIVTNVQAWSTSAQWSAQDGSVINTTPPQWGVEETVLAQLAAQLSVDTAVDVAESDYNISDAALRALGEMMLTAVYRQLCSKTPDPNGPASFYNIAQGESKVVNAAGAPISFHLLMCLRQQVDLNEGCPEQFSIVLSRSVYADFVELMMSVGLAPQEDALLRQPAWFVDRVRVLESGYLASGEGLIFKADLMALPEAYRERVSPSVGRGVVLGSTHAQGVVVSNRKANATTDQSQTTLQVTVGLVHPTRCVGWLEGVGT